MNGRKTGGRPRGSKNKATIALEHGLAQAGGVAIPYLRSVVLDKDADPRLRVRAAESLAPYEQSRLLAVPHKRDPVDAEAGRRARERILARLADMAARRSLNGDQQPS